MLFNIVTDSCCDMTEAMKHSDLYCSIPLTLNIGEKTFRDDFDLNVSSLMEAMTLYPSAMHSSCPSPGDYLSVFEKCIGDIYVVTLSALLSGSHNSACQASCLFLEAHPDRNIYVFNSCSASSGEVLVAAKIAQLARSGMSFDHVVSSTINYITELNTLFVLENLDNLEKAGRLSRVQAFIAEALHTILILGATPEGEICKIGQALSSRQALTKLVETISCDIKHRNKVLCISHCLCQNQAEYLSYLVKRYCSFSSIIITRTRGISSFYANQGGIIIAY